MYNLYKIIVLIPYFGKFPWYFPYFLHSCKFNATIDFLIFSDIDNIYRLPQNVQIINKSFNEIKALISKKLNIDVNLGFPYKLCDFKPAYGLIFDDYTTGYDFWGQSDIDIIYGDLRSFMTFEILNNNDFISLRHDYTTGCFALYRNEGLMNNFFKRSEDYKQVFTTQNYLGFDELNFKHCELNEGRALYEITTEIECFTHLIQHAKQAGEIRAHFDFMLIEGLPGKIKYNKGQLVYDNKYEAALYHLYWLKKIYSPKVTSNKIPDTFYISPSRIYFKNDKWII